MRALLVVLVVCLASAAWAGTIQVPDEDLGITEINQAMDLAASGDEIVVSAGVYDSVRTYVTPFGVRTAVVSMKDGVTLRGVDREDVKIDQSGAEYGILCLNVGAGAVIENLTIRGGIGRERRAADDGDGRAFAGLLTPDELVVVDLTTDLELAPELLGGSCGLLVHGGAHHQADGHDPEKDGKPKGGAEG